MNYKGRNAAAVGAFYRPDEKVMLSVGGTFGNGENMVNAGISFSLDRTARVSNSRTAMAKEIVDLRANVANLTALVGQLTAGMGGTIEMDRMKLFPDVPKTTGLTNTSAVWRQQASSRVILTACSTVTA